MWGYMACYIPTVWKSGGTRPPCPLLRSEIPSGMRAKLRTAAASNNRDHARNLSLRTLVIKFNRSHVTIGRASTTQSLLLLPTGTTIRNKVQAAFLPAFLSRVFQLATKYRISTIETIASVIRYILTFIPVSCIWQLHHSQYRLQKLSRSKYIQLEFRKSRPGVGNLFTITGRIYCASSLAGRKIIKSIKINSFYPKIRPFSNYEEEWLLLTYYPSTCLSWSFVLTLIWLKKF